MKPNLKILYKTPDLDEMAKKHQDFDGLMDSLATTKAGKRNRLQRFGSFVLVIAVTAFLSWLYWGYEPAGAELPVETRELSASAKSEEQSLAADTVVEKTEKPVTEVKPEPVSPANQQADQPLPDTKTEQASNTSQKSETDSNDLALPEVKESKYEFVSAEPAQGLENLYEYLYGRIHLPDSLLDQQSSLFFEVSFTVSAVGSVNNVGFSKDFPVKIDSALTQVFEQMPTWQAARENEQPVSSEVKLPITFQKKN